MFVLLSSFFSHSFAGFAEVEKKRPGPKKAKKEEVTPELEEGDGESAPVVKTVDRWRDSLLSSSSLSQVCMNINSTQKYSSSLHVIGIRDTLLSSPNLRLESKATLLSFHHLCVVPCE